MRVLRLVGLLLLGVVILAVLAGVGARFHDGPIGPFPGGPLRAGPLNEDPVDDWSFAANEETIELQLLSQDRSRTTWILVQDGSAFIPCSLGFPPGKTWHQHALEDGRAVLRIQGQRYPVGLQRADDPALAETLEGMVDEKYGGAPPSDAGVWFFRVTSQSP